MKVVFALFNGVSAIDVCGPACVLSRVAGCELVYAAARAGALRTDAGQTIHAERAFAEVRSADLLVVPGSSRPWAALRDTALLTWLRDVDASTRLTTSVCTGSLLLAAAGLLDGRNATSHWLTREALAAYGARPLAERVVVDGKFVTAAGVSAGIDMALAVVALCYGLETRDATARAINYAPEPPFDAGCPQRAPLFARLMVTLAFSLLSPPFYAHCLRRACAALLPPPKPADCMRATAASADRRLP